MSQSREQKEYLSLSYDLAQFHKLIEFIIKIILLVFLYLFLCPLPLCISLGQKPLFVYHSSTPDSRLRLLYIDDCLMMMESKNRQQQKKYIRTKQKSKLCKRKNMRKKIEDCKQKHLCVGEKLCF